MGEAKVERDFAKFAQDLNKKRKGHDNIWLVVSTHLKNISQNGNLPQIGMKIKNMWNHHPDMVEILEMALCLSSSSDSSAV